MPLPQMGEALRRGCGARYECASHAADLSNPDVLVGPGASSG